MSLPTIDPSTAAPARRSRCQAAAAAIAVALAAPFVLATPAHAHGGKAHTHGQAQLDVAVEPGRITFLLSSPLESLVGFERAPRNEKERAQVQAALARLSEAGTLFKIDPAAHCKPGKVELTSAALGLGTAGAEAKGGHADLDGSFEFTCADSAKAAHVDVGLFEFKRLHRLDVQVATPTGQLKRSLKPSAARLPLGR